MFQVEDAETTNICTNILSAGYSRTGTGMQKISANTASRFVHIFVVSDASSTHTFVFILYAVCASAYFWLKLFHAKIHKKVCNK